MAVSRTLKRKRKRIESAEDHRMIDEKSKQLGELCQSLSLFAFCGKDLTSS